MATTLLKNGTIIDTGNKRLMKSDVLVRDGIIAEVSEAIPAPEGAEVMGLYRTLYITWTGGLPPAHRKQHALSPGVRGKQCGQRHHNAYGRPP